MVIKRGDTFIKRFFVRDKSGVLPDADGTPLTGLSSALEIIFMVKENKEDDDTDAIVTAKKTTTGISVINATNPNFTDEGNVNAIEVTITASAMADVDPGRYFMGLQIKDSSGIVTEVSLSKDGVDDTLFKVVQDVIGAV